MATRWRGATGLAMVLFAGCVSQDPTYFFASVLGYEASFVPRGEEVDLQIEANVFYDAQDVVLVDGATVTVRGGAETLQFLDPDLETKEVPGADVGSQRLTLRVPSPFDDLEQLEAYCGASGRFADVTLNLYARENDRDPSQPPPLSQVSFTAALTRTGTPPSNGLFASTGLTTALSTVSGATPIVTSVVPNGSDGALFAAATSSTVGTGGSNHQLYSADADSTQRLVDLGVSVEPPAIRARSGGGSLVAMYEEAGRVALTARSSSLLQEWTTAWLRGAGGSDASSILRPSRLLPSGTNTRVVLQSSSAIAPELDPGAELQPPVGKYYGSFEYEVDPSGTILSSRVSDRDLLARVELSGGEAIEVTSEIAPRAAGAALRIEQLDTMGVPSWTHEEPALAYEVSLATDPSGDVFVAFEDESLGSIAHVVRIDGATGDRLWDSPISGRRPTLVASGDGGVLVALTGVVGAAPAGAELSVSMRPAPLLLRLDATGALTKAAQIACGGELGITSVEGGDPMLVGTFSDKAAIGDASASTGSPDLGAILTGAVSSGASP